MNLSYLHDVLSVDPCPYHDTPIPTDPYVNHFISSLVPGSTLSSYRIVSAHSRHEIVLNLPCDIVLRPNEGTVPTTN